MNVVSKHPRDIFLAAIRLPDDGRDAYLDQVCGTDAGLRLRVAALLQAHDAAGPIASAPESEQTASSLTDALGTSIGPYKLREALGDGGMGIVYTAEQEQPIRRKVALKVIKPGMDSKEVIARFEAERQALALMEHPNIAKVIDAGTTDTGRPYFVMELVRGMPITEYCDQVTLNLRDRLKLFITVCQAVQHAHQKGIIHRDLKPSNVMITLHDGVPVPKVIDFGVAKALNQRLTEHTLYTRHSQLLGTPMYMSPEQAELSGLDIDTRSDVYALGVLLYELLTGRTPFDKETLSKLGFDELRRMIREDDPLRPSLRVSTLVGEDRSTVASQRGIDERHLSRSLSGELDWIVMKALEKDRNRRYESASAFAADVQRFLGHEPVAACPPSAGYRFRKFASRNKVALTTAVLVSVAVLLGIVGTTWQAIRATRERDRAFTAEGLAQARLDAETQARRDAESQRLRAEAARRETEAQRQLAEANFRKAREAVDQMLTRVAEERLAEVPQMEPVRRALLEDALKFYQEFLQQKSSDPAVRLETAHAYRRAASIQNYLGQPAEAEGSYRKAILLLEELVTEAPSDVNCRAPLAETYYSLGGLLTHYLSAPQEAERVLRESVRLHARLTAEYPNVAVYRSNWVKSQIDLSSVVKPQESERVLRNALEVSEELAAESPSEYGKLPALVYVTLGRVLWATGYALEAEKAFRQSVAIHEKAMAQDPDSADLAWDVAFSRTALAQFLARNGGRHHEAEQLLREAIPQSQKIVSKFPNALIYPANQGQMYLLLARALAAQNRVQEAEQVYRQALTILEKVLHEGPRTDSWRTLLAETQDELAGLLKRAGRTEEAQDVGRQAVALFEQFVTNYPSVPDYRADLARRHFALAKLLRDIVPAQEADTAYQRGLTMLEKLALEYPNDHRYLFSLALSRTELALLLSASGRNEEAEQACRQALADFQKSVELVPQNATLHNNAAWFLVRYPGMNRQRIDHGLAWAKKAVELAPQAGYAWNTLGVAYYRAADWKTAIESLEKSMELRNGGDGFDWFFLAMAHGQLDHKDEARKWRDQAVEWMEKNAPQNEELIRFRREAEALIRDGPTM